MTERHSARISITLRNGAGVVTLELTDATTAELVEWLTPVWAYLLDAAAKMAELDKIEP